MKRIAFAVLWFLINVSFSCNYSKVTGNELSLILNQYLEQITAFEVKSYALDSDEDFEKLLYAVRDSSNKFNQEIFRLNQQQAIIKSEEDSLLLKWQQIELRNAVLERSLLNNWKQFTQTEHQELMAQLNASLQANDLPQTSADIALEDVGLNPMDKLKDQIAKMEVEHAEIMQDFDAHLLRIEAYKGNLLKKPLTMFSRKE